MSIIRATRLLPTLAPYPHRTHSCGDISLAHVGSNVVLAGWLLPERCVPPPPPTPLHLIMISPKSRKISNVLSFFPIKDPSGTTQLVVRRNPHVQAQLSDIPVESSVLIQGRVSERPKKDRRPVSSSLLSPLSSSLTRTQSPTGDVEVHVDSFTLLNPASPVLPFYPSNDHSLVRLFPLIPSPRSSPSSHRSMTSSGPASAISTSAGPPWQTTSDSVVMSHDSSETLSIHTVCPLIAPPPTPLTTHQAFSKSRLPSC